MREQAPSPVLWKTECVCAAARRSARALTRLYDRVLTPTGLKITQVICLMEIAEAGEIAQWQLSRGNAVATETLSRRLRLGSTKGMLKVRRGTKRGERMYSLTPYGEECLRNALPYISRAEDRLARALGGIDFKQVLSLLDQLSIAAHEAEEIRTKNSAANKPTPSRLTTSSRPTHERTA